MLIARTKADGANGPRDLSFGVIGTCRVHNPMRAMIEQGLIDLVWREFNAFTHGPTEAIQYLRFVRGEGFIPGAFAPFIFRTEETPAVGEKLSNTVRELDFLIVEVSAFSRISCGPYEFQQNYFSENFIRKGGADYLNWWRDVTQGKPSMASADELVSAKSEGLSLHDEEILRTLRFANLSDDEFQAEVQKLSQIAGLPLLLVPHFSFDDQDNAISRMRARNRKLLGASAKQLSHAFFDPSPLLMDYGREAALKNEGRDLYHYSPEFDAHIGHALLSFIGEMKTPERSRSVAV